MLYVAVNRQIRLYIYKGAEGSRGGGTEVKQALKKIVRRKAGVRKRKTEMK